MTSPRTAAGPPSNPTLAPRPFRAGRRRWRWVWPGAAVLLVGVAETLIWFQPQKLFYDQRIDEGVPGAAAPATAPATGSGSAPAGAGPAVLASGTFVAREHPTHGTARLLRLSDGRVVVRFENFATSNGPLLVVWLSRNPAAGPDRAFDDQYVSLGALKGNVGDQNYAVPAGVDATAYTSVVVWCDRFSVSFGAADLVPSA